MRETLGSQGVQILLEKLKDQEEKQTKRREKENSLKTVEVWIPMILRFQMRRRKVKKQRITRRIRRNREISEMEEVEMILPVEQIQP